MNIKLSKRLQWIADWVPEGSRLADIGSDHALLPVYLAKHKRISFAVAGEVNQGPFEAARRQVQGACMEMIVNVRHGDGLSVVKQGEVDCITIAGMGGSLIATILSADPKKLEGVTRLILQPNVGEDIVRRWLREQGWALVQEHILEEDGKIYEVLLAERLADRQLLEEHNERLYKTRQLPCGIALTEDWLFLMGPLLSLNPSSVFVQKWEHELGKWERVLRTMEQAETEEARERRIAFAKKQAEMERIVACLQTLKR
ncbi:class I SAM-dependent methyltransferase [Paenibacillus sp. MER TA 81-3]|uniref:tRNA (adenine(22)-N(1))-methyltransferase n=1 Tax=Paenibacillus sp. MER TA 81-3 TaxID=2939573 RepID=UPI0020400E95|nr:class I SAM-dependent methyltransferase [Paenibacillus sp. MER TA 81-3]MCM3339690.1 class I SAM-dependent methyltransferase [Paenibacillus sp. MER TA 81-3]